MRAPKPLTGEPATTTAGQGGEMPLSPGGGHLRKRSALEELEAANVTDDADDDAPAPADDDKNNSRDAKPTGLRRAP